MTTATVRAPASLAAWEMTGAAPVPVPPPMPAVMNTMSVFCTSSRTWSMLSRAALRPTSGFAPAPRPLVSLPPSWMVWSARDFSISWASVLAAMKLTPDRRDWIMLLMALPPPPPQPMTLFFALMSFSISKCAMGSSSQKLFGYST